MPANRKGSSERRPRGGTTEDADLRPDTDEQADVEEPEESAPSRRRPRQRRLPAGRAAQAALQHITDLTGREPVGVVSVDPADNGWLVTVEVIEDRRVPSSADILAMYEAEIDLDGELLSYGRTQRYMRGHGVNGSRR